MTAGSSGVATVGSHAAEHCSGAPKPLTLVLDTNVVIDWLVFDHPYMNPLRKGIQDRSIVALTHPRILEELRRVLGYRVLDLDEVRRRDVLEHYESQTVSAQLPNASTLDRSSLPRNFPRCRDPDDDLFLALAYHASASALVSRDKAVLKLKRRAARFGLEILDVQALIEERLAGRGL